MLGERFINREMTRLYKFVGAEVQWIGFPIDFGDQYGPKVFYRR